MIERCTLRTWLCCTHSILGLPSFINKVIYKKKVTVIQKHIIYLRLIYKYITISLLQVTIFKLDIEKAYDYVYCNSLLYMLD